MALSGDSQRPDKALVCSKCKRYILHKEQVASVKFEKGQRVAVCVKCAREEANASVIQG